MRVKIRTIDQADGVDCGEMNPEQLHIFVKDLCKRGVYWADTSHYWEGWDNEQDGCIDIQYVLGYNEFFVELIITTKEK